MYYVETTATQVTVYNLHIVVIVNYNYIIFSEAYIVFTITILS